MPKKTELSEEDQLLRERIGIAVRQVAAAHGLKPQDVARICGVSLAHQYRVESGETTPDAIYLFKVASHVGVPLTRFFESLGPAAKVSERETTDAKHSVTMKISSKHGHAAGRDVNANSREKNGKGDKPHRARSGT